MSKPKEHIEIGRALSKVDSTYFNQIKTLCLKGRNL